MHAVLRAVRSFLLLLLTSAGVFCACVAVVPMAAVVLALGLVTAVSFASTIAALAGLLIWQSPDAGQAAIAAALTGTASLAASILLMNLCASTWAWVRRGGAPRDEPFVQMGAT